MNRFFRFLLGTKPKAGTYYVGEYKRVLLPEDIGDKYVRIRNECLADDLLTFRGFHLTYGTIDKQRYFK